MYPKDSVLGGEIFDLQQQFLIHQTRHVCQKSGQLVTGVHPTCIFSGLGFCTSFEYFDLTAKNQYLLRGLIKCGLCGRTYIGVAANRPNGKREFYYRCNGAHSPAVFSPKGKCCSKAIRGDELEQQVRSDVETFLRTPEPVLSALHTRLESQGKGSEQGKREITMVASLLAEKATERNRILGLYRRGRLTDGELDVQLGVLRPRSMSKLSLRDRPKNADRHLFRRSFT